MERRIGGDGHLRLLPQGHRAKQFAGGDLIETMEDGVFVAWLGRLHQGPKPFHVQVPFGQRCPLG